MIPQTERAYALSSFLIGKGKAAAMTVLCTQCYEYGGENYSWWPEYAADIGPATSQRPTKDSQGVWMRWYKNAVAIVNPAEKTVAKVTLPHQAQGYRDLFAGAPFAKLDGLQLTIQPVNGTVLLFGNASAPSSTPSPKPAPPAGECAGETLYNGLCLPKAWPPRFDPEAKPAAEYFRAPPAATPPAVINITVGRQLLVDDFLIEKMHGLERQQHQPEWVDENPVIEPDRPWEAIDLNDTQHRKENRTGGDWPTSTVLGTAMPYSGGNDCLLPEMCGCG